MLGFNQRGSDAIVPIAECPVLMPAIVGKLPTLREIASIALKPRKRVRIAVLAADNGLDVAISGGGHLDAAQLTRLGAFGSDAGIARLTLDHTTIFANRTPEVSVGDATLLPPPGGFIQAVASAEVAMADAVLAHVGDDAPVADLFAGIGTFSLRLARRAAGHRRRRRRHPARRARRRPRAARRGLKPLTRACGATCSSTRWRRSELDAFGAVVFDPPAAGAKRQAEALAQSRVPKVVAVSCNPATLARDARILIDGGYRLTRVLPVDQFLWSAEIEVVACFAR